MNLQLDERRDVMRTGNERSHEFHRRSADWARLRARLLTEAGFAADTSQRLARRPEADVHALLDLVDRGCPPHLAVRILAPIDDAIDPQ